ncbi:MAG: hypothetical protein KC996_09915 [Phycisphaerales bacterium]|nr:hypothetical protein [Phycisphaerales bacterium]
MTHPRPMLVVRLVLCAALTTIPGCRSVHAARFDPPPGSTLVSASNADHSGETAADDRGTESRWPARWGDNPDTRGVIIPLDRPWNEFRAAHLGRHSTLRSSEIEYADAEILAGALGKESGFRFKAEGPGSFVFVPRVEPSDAPSIKPEPELAFKFVSARPIVQNFRVKSAKLNSETGVFDIETESTDEEDSVRLQRTWFTLRMPADAEHPIGTLVLLPGMFGTPEPVIDGVESFLLGKGWAVVRMMSHPSNFTGYLRLDIEPGSEELIGELTAGIYDQRTAECAYATDAALGYVRQQRPQLAEHPTALLGMSGGAMILPAVYALDPDSYDAAVLIAGGANSMLITAMSNYREMIDAVRFDFDPETPELDEDGSREQLLALSDAYLAQSRLDAFHTAHEMRGLPVLMLHATRDKAVPFRRGDDLYEALGKPERWTYPVGHELIFAALPTQAGRINDWLVDALGIEGSEP